MIGVVRPLPDLRLSRLSIQATGLALDLEMQKTALDSSLANCCWDLPQTDLPHADSGLGPALSLMAVWGREPRTRTWLGACSWWWSTSMLGIECSAWIFSLGNGNLHSLNSLALHLHRLGDKKAKENGGSSQAS